MSAIAQLVVYNAHNGTCVEIPKPVRFHTLQSLKEYLLEAFSNRATGNTENIFLLSSFGIKVNFHTINDMAHLYYYDRRLFDKAALKEEALRYCSSGDVAVPDFPESFVFVDDVDEKKIVASFAAYEQWARGLLQQAARSQKSCEVLIRKINYIFKSLNIIFQFISNFVKSAEKTFTGHYASIKLLWTKSLRNTWQSHYNTLKQLPAVHFANSKAVRLAGYLSESDFLLSAEFLNEHLPLVVDRFNALSGTMTSINEETFQIDKMIEGLRSLSAQKFKNYEAVKRLLADEIEAYNAAFSEDAQQFRSVSRRDQRVIYGQQREMAAKFYAASQSIHSYLVTLYRFHRDLVAESVPIFQAIASLQMNAVTLRNDSKLLMAKSESPTPAVVDEDEKREKHVHISHELVCQVRAAEDSLSMAVDLPLLFGFSLIEKRRQFEWRDFFLKGLVNNVSEQLTVVIEHEKSFQSLWIKKFGNYIRTFSPDADLLPQIPVVDVTLVNGDQSQNPNNIFAWIDAQDLVREDILQYIEVLKKNGYEKFAGILEKNYKDMCSSTTQMNRMTRVVSSIGAHAHLSDDALLKSQAKKLGVVGDADDQDNYDINLVEGLKLRIRKLENLLHLNQFKNLTNWPVVRSDHVPLTGQMSLIVSNPKEPAQNPLKFLQKGVSSPEVPTVKSPKVILDASTTIDKHLDNIRLRRESNNLQTQLQKLQQQNQELQKQNQELRLYSQELQLQNRELELRNSETRESNERQQAELNTLRQEVTDKSSLCEQLEQDLKQARLQLQNTENEKNKEAKAKIDQVSREKEKAHADLESLRIEYTAVKAEMQDLVKFKSELLTNMLDKEQDFASEKSDLQRKISDLASELELKTDDFENLMEHMQTKAHAAEQLLVSVNGTLKALFHAIEQLSRLSIEYFREFCLVTQSMGLLLVCEPRSDDGRVEYRIKRVKGLRTRNSDEPDTDHLPAMKTAVIKDVDDAFSWLQTTKEELDSLKLEAYNGGEKIPSAEKTLEAMPALEKFSSSDYSVERLESQAEALVQIFSRFLTAHNNDVSLLEKATKILSFKENVQLQAHDNKSCVDEGFFYNGIIKRFSDVEGYAKKLTKENKMKAAELAKSVKAQSGKISINNFQEGDLVLFLPTVQNSDTEEEEQTPWTAFNIDAPHYFLDSESQPEQNSKEWVVNRIAKIVPQEVTEENVSDRAKNPYSLSAGDCWFLVLTKP